MLWEIGGYWGMGHFQNKGAAGGLDLRHHCVDSLPLRLL